jgi:DNA-binding MarR family transcriptional regulator
MMKHGVLDSGKNSRDKRRKELFLTEQGRVLVSSISQQRSRWLTATIGQEFTEEEAVQLDAALELLHKISDKTSAPTSKFIPVAPQAEQG